MIDRIILMCAGRAERWAHHRGVPKHLVPINGEMLLDRTLRLIRHETSAKIVIVAFNPAYNRPGHERFEPDHGPTNFCDTDKFLSSTSRWAADGQTILLYGDVFFTPRAIAAILNHQGEHRFFGRREGSLFTGHPWRELFALSFPASERALMLENMLHVKSRLLAGQIPRGGGWELYEHMHKNSGDHFTTIDDFTDDFDYPADYENWLKHYQNPLHRLLVPLYGTAAKRWRWRISRSRTRIKNTLRIPSTSSQ